MKTAKSTHSEVHKPTVANKIQHHLPPYYGAFYVIGFILSAVGFQLVLQNAVQPYEREVAFNWYNSIFLSQHAIFWTTVFFFLATLSVVFGIKTFNGVIKRIRGGVLVLTVFCSIVYHMYLSKTDTIRNYARDIKHFDLYMFIQHGMCAFLMLMDLVLSSYHQQKVCFSRNIGPLCVYAASYVGYITYAYKVRGVWPYAFMNKFSVEELNVFIAFSVLAAILTLGVFCTISHYIAKLALKGPNMDFNTSEYVYGKMHDLANSTKSVKNYINSKVHDQIEHAKNDVLPKGKELGNMVQKKASDLAQKGSEKAKSLFNNMEHKAEKVAKDVKDKIQEKSSQAKHSASSSISSKDSSKSSSDSKVSHSKHSKDSSKDSLKDSTKESAQSVKNSVEAKVQQVGKTAQKTVDSAIAKVAGKTAQVAESVASKAHEVENKKKR